jgi:hypothetical protein
LFGGISIYFESNSALLHHKSDGAASLGKMRDVAYSKDSKTPGRRENRVQPIFF